jgi:hypothetical protein
MALVDDLPPSLMAQILAKACCKKSFSTVSWPIFLLDSQIQPFSALKKIKPAWRSRRHNSAANHFYKTMSAA